MPSSASPVPAGLLTRLRSAWFGPSVPLAPEAPPGTAGRQFDYPVGFNLRLQPRQDEGTSFADLRGLADAYDLVRLVIETRKDQIEALDWQIRQRRGGPSDDPRIAAIEDLLRTPDREHPWGTWVRLLLEDLFVLDAPTLYVRRTATGALWGLEVVDGATIKRLLGPDGRTPQAPDPAYQQVLKGIPAVDYTTDELIYAPRNPRPHKVYGYSPVEQILMTVNIGLRRQVSQLNYFTEGNTPEALIGVPEQWTPDQIRQFQEYWDALLEGNLAARRHTRFVPGGLKYQPIRDVPLKDDFDEWLARVVCFAFSIPPTAFSKQTNRATAESAQESATAEGLQPLLVWLKSLIDRIIAQVLGCDDLEFAWSDRTAPDTQTQATIAAAYVGAGIKTRNEVRAELGLDPIVGGDTLTTATPAAALPAGMAKADYNDTENRNADGEWARSNSSTNDAFTNALMEAVDVDTGQTGFETAQNLKTLAWLTGPESPIGMAPGGGLAWLPFSPEVAAVGEFAGALAEIGLVADRLPVLRPTWQQSEIDVGRELGPTARAQVSYKDGFEVPAGMPRSVRPDFTTADTIAVEVKNYDIATNTAALIRTVAEQTLERASHLPPNMVQNVIIDIRGQTVTKDQQLYITQRLVARTQGVLEYKSIKFKG